MKKTLKSMLAVFFCILMISATASSASALGKPTVKVKSVAYNSVTIYWTAVSGADYYQVQRTTNGKTWTNLNTTVKATTYTDSKGLTTGVAYGYRVRAVDKSLLGRLTYSAWTGMVTAKPIPAKVTGLKVKASTHNSVQLTWTKVAGATGYTVQLLNGKTWKNYKSLTGNVLNVTGLALGKTYSFRVLAYRTVSKKNIYGAASAVLKASPTLKAPTTVVLSAVTAKALKVQWNTAAGAKGYEIYRADTKKWTNNGTKTAIIFNNLKPGTKYSFIVRAYSGAFKGTQTKTYTFQTMPAAPTGLKVTDATDKSITFTWNKVTGAAGYHVQKSTDNKTWSNVVASTTSNSVTASGLKGNTKYYFRVRAFVKNTNVYKINTTNYGVYSASLNYTTVLTAPTVTAAAVNDTTIKLSWAAVAGAKSYMIERYDNTTSKWFVYDFAANKWTAPDNLASSITTTTARTLTDVGYSDRADIYRVRAIDASGKKGTASANVTGRTSSIYISDTDTAKDRLNANFTRKQCFTIRQFIAWPKVEGATVYKIYTRNPITEYYTEYKLSELYTDKSRPGLLEATVYFAPNSIHSIKVYAYGANGEYLGAATNDVTFSIGAVPMYATSHAYYKGGVNSQLLYAARAINNTKAYNGEITVKNNLTLNFNTNYLKVPAIISAVFIDPEWLKIPIWDRDQKTQDLIDAFTSGVCDTPEEVEALFSRIDDTEESPTSSTEKTATTLTFENGKAVNEEGRTVTLRSHIEPSANANQSAYLYGSKNPAGWVNKIKNVTTTKNADGGYTISFTINQETTNANYHGGFVSTFDASDFGVADGFNVKNIKIGATTLKLVIGPDGILKSYAGSSPYSANFSASFVSTEEGESETFDMEMGISGSNVFNYTFTK